MIFHHDEFRGLTAAARDGEQGTHAELLHLCLFQHRDFQLAALGELAGFIREIARGADVGRQVAQGAGQGDAAGDGRANPQAFFRLLALFAAAGQQRELLQRRLVLVFAGALALVEAIGDFLSGFYRVAREPEGVRALDGEQGEGTHGFLHARLVQRAHRFLHRLAVAAQAEVALGTETHQQHALRLEFGHIEQQQGLAGAPLDGAALGQLAEIAVARLVQRMGRSGQLAAFEQPHDQAGRSQGFGGGGLHGKLHAGLPVEYVGNPPSHGVSCLRDAPLLKRRWPPGILTHRYTGTEAGSLA